MSRDDSKQFSEPPGRPDWLPVRETERALEITEFVPGSSHVLIEEEDSHGEEQVEYAEKETADASLARKVNGETLKFSRPFPHPLRHPLAASFWIIRGLFAMVSLILLLALLAAIPIVNFLALGYLLEAEGSVARSGRFRDAFGLLDVAPRIGTIAVGIWIWLMPLRLLSDLAADARLIDPHSGAAIWLGRITIPAAIAISVHLLLALARGGRFWCFFRPIKNVRSFLSRIREGGFARQAENRIRAFFARMRLGYHFWLGVRGFLGALIWLLPPTALLAVADQTEGGPILISVLGGFCLIVVLSWIPFLQARFAAQNRFRAFFELRTIRQLFTRAPLAWMTAVIVVFVLALPLYLFKVVAPPRDAMWFITPVFIASIFPARMLTGWAYYRAETKPQPSRRIFRWASRFVIFPLLTAYVILLFLTPAIGQHGKGVLFEHHAFLLPVPF